MAAPPLDLATFLAGAALGLTSGVNLFVGRARDVGPEMARDAVFVSPGSGREPDRAMGDAINVRWPLVHVQVRNGNFQAGDVLARSILDALKGANVSGYLDAAALQSEPSYLGEDEPGRHSWSITVRLTYQAGA